MVVNINCGGGLIAQHFDFTSDIPVNFPTPSDVPFQLGYGTSADKYVVKPHMHKRVKREINTTCEFIYVISGEINIEIFDETSKLIKSLIISTNEGFLQYFGGHKITIMAGTKYLEIKQGPYFGREYDKEDLQGESL
jgi:hypothetical protein